MEKKQTAVEWLYERLERMIPKTALYDIDKKQYYEQAKEMEKEQIIDANISGQMFIGACPGNYKFNYSSFFKSYNDAEQYYNETFKKD